jgi:cytochrome c
VGRDIAAADGFSYSDALASLDQAWTPENLSGFLENPRGWAPGTAMAYNGMGDVEDRANLIAYLATQE